MEGSKSRADVIKPVILKAGIPLAISMAGFICAKIIAMRRKAGERSESEPCNEEQMSLDVRDNPGIREEVLGLGRMLHGLQEREWKLEMQFLRYCELRDREALLLEIGNLLELELGRVEALSREVVSMEYEHKRIAEIALEYAEVLEEMQCLRSENQAMQRRLKKLLTKVKGQSGFTQESELRIEAQEKEISSTRSTLESVRYAVKKMQGEVQEMRQVMEQMRQEKDDLRIRLNSVEESVLKMKEGGAPMEDFKQLLKEQEQLQEERSAEEELIYLRWSNACLRHEMMRNHQDNQENRDFEIAKTESTGLEVAEDEIRSQNHESDREGPSPRTKTATNHSSKRKKLLKKLKRWVEGNGREHNTHNTQLKLSPADAEEHPIIQGRRPCSSAQPDLNF